MSTRWNLDKKSLRRTGILAASVGALTLTASACGLPGATGAAEAVGGNSPQPAPTTTVAPLPSMVTTPTTAPAPTVPQSPPTTVAQAPAQYGPSSTNLPTYTGPKRITSPMTISNVTINGEMEILAPVTMSNVNMNCTTGWACIRVWGGGSLNISNFRIDGGGTRSAQNSGGLIGSNITARNGEIVGVENGIVGGSNQLIEDVYIHGLQRMFNDPSNPGHPDGVQYDGGNSNIVLRRVRIEAARDSTSAVMIDNENGPVSGIVLDSCVVSGGQFTVYLEGAKSSSTISATMTGNSFGWSVYGPVLRRGPVVLSQSSNTVNGAPTSF